MDALSKVLTGASSVIQPKAKAHSQAGFDMFFAVASERRNMPVETTDSAPRSRNGNGNGNGSDDNSRTRVDRADNPTRNNMRTRSNTTQETGTDVNCVEQPTYAPVDSNSEVDADTAIVAIAAILQLPVEEVAALLDQLNMDIQDLTDPKMVSKFLQLAMGAETPADLLKDPNFPEMFKAINEKMAELVLEAETTVISGKAVDVAQTLQVAEALQVVDIEGLQVSFEDGQLIVAEEAKAEATTTTNTTSEATTTTQVTTEAKQEVSQNTLLHNDGEGLKMADVETAQDQSQITNPVIDANSSKTVAQEIIKNSTPAPQVDAGKVIEQIMSQVKATSVGGNFAEMRMTLRPESLGDIVLRVMTQNGIVTAQFEAESQRVKEALEANFNQLREALEQQGLTFSELSVSVRQEKGNASEFERGRQSTRHRMESLNGVGEVEEEAPQIVSLHDGEIDIIA
jgi:flagellar hook-length control protein FliK